MEKWVIAAKRADFQKIAEKFGVDPVIARLIRNRDIVEEDAIREYLWGGLNNLHSPWLMKDMQKAVELLELKIRCRKRIRIIGDYDIDGIISTYILKRGLQKLGAWVDVKIPDRITDGYGINENLITQASEDGIDTIITCDNGIAASGPIALAKELGLQVVVTDHHEVPFERDTAGNVNEIIPCADAVVNPKQRACGYPFKGLCGGGVAYKLITAMYEHFGLPEDAVFEFLEFAAIATVGDVMDLKGENRILVKEGLKRLHKTENPGLLELARLYGLNSEEIGTYHIGFLLGPCLNASGRLDTAQRALALLEAGDQETAARLAGDLKSLNDSRKEMTVLGVERVIELIEGSSLKQDKVLVVYMPECHESLAGIIAGRIREKYHKPAIVLTRTAEGVKGSGRSIEAYSMYEELCKCREYLTKFGGHPMAAGMSMEEENVPRFRKKLNEVSVLTEEDFIEKVTIDVPMPISYIRRELVEQMELLQPFGKGNEKPVFAQKQITPLNCRIFGKNRNVAKLLVRDESGCCMDAVYFGNAEAFAAYATEHEQISIVYYPTIRSWQGRETLQITIQYYQ